MDQTLRPFLDIPRLKDAFDGGRMESLIESLARFGGDGRGGVTRLAFSREDLEARTFFMDAVRRDLGLSWRMDPLGNLFFRRPGRDPDAPVIMTGSHLDSVRNGGRYDGPAGLVCAFEAFRVLDALGLSTAHPLELVVFTSEEPNPFGISTFGSRGIAGKLSREELESLKDDRGTSLRDALAFIGGDLDRIHEARIPPGRIAYFVELHIEQMPFLEREGKDIGVVTGITGIHRKRIRVKGRACHCGTTSMENRRDALCAASEIILALEAAAKKEKGKAVATVGHLQVFPNSINITPGEVEMDAEVRSFHTESLERILGALDETIRRVQAKRGVSVQVRNAYTTHPIRFSRMVRDAIFEAAQRLGHSTLEEISMAGHDAAHLTEIAECGMIFVPCKGGESHCPEEFTETRDLIKGAETLLMTLLILDEKGIPGEGER